MDLVHDTELSGYANRLLMTWREFIMKLDSYNLCFGFVVLTQISKGDFGVV
jgi:hypothetical protein